MAERNLSPEEIADLGEKIYREKIRPLMTEADIGRYLIIDVISGEYEIDDDDLAADDRLSARLPEASGYIMRVGYSAAYFMGGHYEEPNL